MNFVTGTITICFALNSWSLPTDHLVKSGSEDSSEIGLFETAVEDAIKSVQRETSLFKFDPSFMNIQKLFQTEENESQKVPFPLLAELEFPLEKHAYDIEYATTKLTIKPDKNDDNNVLVIKKTNYIPMQQEFDDIQDIPQTFQNLEQIPIENILNENENEVKDTQEGKLEQMLTSEQRIVEQQQDILNNQQDDVSVKKENCNYKCEEILEPICGVNVHNKYAIFENYCDMKINNCYNPELDWQPLPKDVCRKTLHGFYKRLQKFFSENYESEHKNKH